MPGRMMGSMMAGAPWSRVSAAQASALGAAAPPGASVDGAQNRISFRTGDVRFWALASPDRGPDMTFRIVGLAEPTIVVPQGARVTIEIANADLDTSHGWLLIPASSPFSYMPMIQVPPAFSGALAPPLGDAGTAGMPYEGVQFVASRPDRYTYLCTVPGHAARGMYGTLVAGAS
jgi:rusticyanin